jgi:hypothetical protein
LHKNRAGSGKRKGGVDGFYMMIFFYDLRVEVEKTSRVFIVRLERIIFIAATTTVYFICIVIMLVRTAGMFLL